MPALPVLEDLRLASERRMREEIDAVYGKRMVDFTRAAKAIDEFEDAESPPGERQFFLAEGIRMSPLVAPGLHDLAHVALQRLGIDTAVEFYIYRTDRPDAFCSYDRERAIFSVCVSPEYINILEEPELLDLLGHEIGHAVLDHVQNRYLMAENLYLDLEDWERDMSYSVLGRHEKKQVQKARDALEILDPAFLARCRRLARLQELSADRLGLLCSRDLGASLVSHMKELTGGLSNKFVRYDTAAIIAQLDEIDSLDKHAADLFDGTHPITAVRMKSLTIFEQSEKYARFIGRMGYAHSAEEADELVDDLLRTTERFPSRESDRNLIAAVSAGAIYLLEPQGLTTETFASLESGLYRLLEYSEIPRAWIEVEAARIQSAVRDASRELAGSMTVEERSDVLNMAVELAHVLGKLPARSRPRAIEMAGWLDLEARSAEKALHDVRHRPAPERRERTRRGC